VAKRVNLREQQLSRRVQAYGPQAPADEAFLSGYPMLGEFLTRPLVYNGKVLEMPRLSFSLGDGDWQLSLSDGVLCQSTSVRAATFSDALVLLERLLATGEAKWSQWKGKEPRLPRPKENGQPPKVDGNGRKS